MSAGQCREDLCYRIAVTELQVPPLRERREYVLWFARRFLDEQARAAGEAARVLRPAAQAALLAHPWPGNVRELRNRIERACILGEGVALSAEDLVAERASPAPHAAAAASVPPRWRWAFPARRCGTRCAGIRCGATTARHPRAAADSSGDPSRPLPSAVRSARRRCCR